jgi:transposase
MPETETPMTAREVAELYGVNVVTVYRWVEAEMFDKAPTKLPSPSGERDRLLFDRAAVLAQHERETNPQ